VSSTPVEQRRWNYALQPMSEDAFVEVVTQGQSVAPLYFAYTADSNRRLRDLLDDAEPPVRLGVEDLERCLRDDAIVIDGRAPEVFASGHLRGSVNVGLDGRFAEYAGDVVRPGQPLVVVADEGRETEAKVRLARIGFDRVRGAVVDVERILAERPELAGQGTRLAARDLASWGDDEPGLQIVDVRNPSEQESGVVPGGGRHPARPPPRPLPASRYHRAHRRVLRRGLPVLDRGVLAPIDRLHPRRRPPRRLRRLGRRPPPHGHTRHGRVTSPWS
jgi:hydroxyacylglutathione hydrolase